MLATAGPIQVLVAHFLSARECALIWMPYMAVSGNI